MLRLESLESREVPALFILGTPGDDSVSIDRAGEGLIAVTVNGKTSVSPAQDVVVKTFAGNDDITNNTSVNFTAYAGAGRDIVFGGSGTNVIGLGTGRDTAYALLGVNTIVSRDGQPDRVFTNAGAQVSSDLRDAPIVRFFNDGRVPGSGRIESTGGVLYITPPDGGSSVRLSNRIGNSVLATWDFGGGVQSQRFDGVRVVSYFGGAGDDTYVNDTDLTEAAYGSAGNDRIVSGRGQFSLLKGSGGDDILIGRADSVDVSGNGGADLIVLGPGNHNPRTDAFDILVS